MTTTLMNEEKIMVLEVALRRTEVERDAARTELEIIRSTFDRALSHDDKAFDVLEAELIAARADVARLADACVLAKFAIGDDENAPDMLMTVAEGKAYAACQDALAAHRADPSTDLTVSQGQMTTDSARPHVVTDPAQAHAAKLETALRHIYEMADEELRTREVDGQSAIWQIEADARALLTTLEAERKAQVTP